MKASFRGLTRTRRLIRALEQRGLALAPIAALKAEVKKSGDKVLATAKALVNVDEGDLRDALSVQISRDGQTARVGIIGKRAAKKGYHGVFIHFGTAPHSIRKGARKGRGGKGGKLAQDTSRLHPGIPANPFLFNALELHRREIVEAHDRAMAAVLAAASAEAGRGGEG